LCGLYIATDFVLIVQR